MRIFTSFFPRASRSIYRFGSDTLVYVPLIPQLKTHGWRLVSQTTSRKSRCAFFQDYTISKMKMGFETQIQIEYRSEFYFFSDEAGR
jgi:hypothetical protein